MFLQVRLDKMVSKWAGSIEIGVTTHSPPDLDFPSTMTNVRSGTWMMTGNGVMHNGTTVFDEYGRNLDKLRVGDRVAVVRKEGGTVHFFVNSEDQVISLISSDKMIKKYFFWPSYERFGGGGSFRASPSCPIGIELVLFSSRMF